MATFVKRTTPPDTSNPLYYSGNPFYLSGWGMPNCTCYAWGRFYELSGEYPRLSTADAENWYSYLDDGYARGGRPKLGAVACWASGSIYDSDDGAGHVAIVEQINPDGSIVTSNSAWGGSLFYIDEVGNTYRLEGKEFLGFIYNPVNFEGGSSVDVPTPISANRFLTMEEMQNNATYIYWYLSSRGWTLNAIAGMLGNMQTESTINPGIWESLTTDPEAYYAANGRYPGYGLVQWTPYTNFTEWCIYRLLDPADMDSALMRIEWELANGKQYYPTDSYPETFAEFKVSTKDPYYLGMAFLLNYERPYDQDQPARGEQAEYWYQYLSGININPGTYSRRKRKFNFVLFGRKQWRATL